MKLDYIIPKGLFKKENSIGIPFRKFLGWYLNDLSVPFYDVCCPTASTSPIPVRALDSNSLQFFNADTLTWEDMSISGGAGENIYNTDGTLTGDRILTLDDHELSIRGFNNNPSLIITNTESNATATIVSLTNENENGAAVSTISDGSQAYIVLSSGYNDADVNTDIQSSSTANNANIFQTTNFNDETNTRIESNSNSTAAHINLIATDGNGVNSLAIRGANILFNNDANGDTFEVNNDGSLIFPKYGDGTFINTPTYLLGADADGNIVEASPSLANPGIDTVLGVGEPLAAARSVVTTGFGITFTDTTNGTPITSNSNSSAAGVFTAQTAAGLQATSTDSVGLTAFSYNDRSATFSQYPLTTNTVTSNIALVRGVTGGFGALGIGQSIEFLEATDSSTRLANTIVSKWTNVADLSRTSEISLQGVVNNSPIATIFKVGGDGKTTLSKYGVGSFISGTPAYSLAIDASGNIMETPADVLVNSVFTMSAADIVSTGGSTYFALIAAPGANKFINIIDAKIYYNYGGVVFSGDGEFGLAYSTIDFYIGASQGVDLSVAIDEYIPLNMITSGSQNASQVGGAFAIKNKSVGLLCSGTGWTGGNGNFKVIITYRIVTLV